MIPRGSSVKDTVGKRSRAGRPENSGRRNSGARSGLAILFAAALLAAGCGGTPLPRAEPEGLGVIRTGVAAHTVLGGETVHSIARSYEISIEALLGANPAVDPERLRVGDRLSIPRRKPEVRRVESRGERR